MKLNINKKKMQFKYPQPMPSIPTEIRYASYWTAVVANSGTSGHGLPVGTPVLMMGKPDAQYNMTCMAMNQENVHSSWWSKKELDHLLVNHMTRGDRQLYQQLSDRSSIITRRFIGFRELSDFKLITPELAANMIKEVLYANQT